MIKEEAKYKFHLELRKLLEWKSCLPCCPFCYTLISCAHNDYRAFCGNCTRDVCIERPKDEDTFDYFGCSALLGKIGPKVYIKINYIKGTTEITNDKDINFSFNSTNLPISNPLALKAKLLPYLPFI